MVDRASGLRAVLRRIGDIGLLASGAALIVTPAHAINPIPEPGTLGLFAAGAATILYVMRKRRK